MGDMLQVSLCSILFGVIGFKMVELFWAWFRIY